MWNLLKGAFYEDDDEEDEESEDVTNAEASAGHIPRATTSASTSTALKVEVASTTPGINNLKSDNASLHLLRSAPREDGDGSEERVTENGNGGLSKTKAPPKTKWILLPETNIRLEKLPPIKDQVRLPEKVPASPLVQMAVCPPKLTRPSSRKKEAKFVPYEPYKAAVSALEIHKTSKRPTAKPAENKAQPGISQQQSLTEDTSLEERGTGIASSSEDETDLEIEALKAKLSDTEKQLKIQMQVNAEVKKLLVASVGEDIEAKVDYLTQDKARLAADIRQYASKISRDFEEKEKLSVESTLWKSKFLACSVIVDDLARGKSVFSHRCEEYEHEVRVLLHEHALLWDKLMQTRLVLGSMNAAFDPSKTNYDLASDGKKANILSLANRTHDCAEALRERLLGKEKGLDQDHAKMHRVDTPAEERLKELLGRTLNGSDYSELASMAVTDMAKPHFRKLGDKLNTPSSSSFQNCTHCHGTVKNV